MSVIIRKLTYWSLLLTGALLMIFAGTAKAEQIVFTGSKGPFSSDLHYSSDRSVAWQVVATGGDDPTVGYTFMNRGDQRLQGIGAAGSVMGTEVGLGEELHVHLSDSRNLQSPVNLESFTLNALHYFTDEDGTPNFWESFEYSVDGGATWTTATQTTDSGQTVNPWSGITPGLFKVTLPPGTRTTVLALRPINIRSGFLLNSLTVGATPELAAIMPGMPGMPGVPEPGSMILLGSAAGLMGWYRRRQSAKKSSS